MVTIDPKTTNNLPFERYCLGYVINHPNKHTGSHRLDWRVSKMKKWKNENRKTFIYIGYTPKQENKQKCVHVCVCMWGQGGGGWFYCINKNCTSILLFVLVICKLSKLGNVPQLNLITFSHHQHSSVHSWRIRSCLTIADVLPHHLVSW